MVFTFGLGTAAQLLLSADVVAVAAASGCRHGCFEAEQSISRCVRLWLWEADRSLTARECTGLSLAAPDRILVTASLTRIC